MPLSLRSHPHVVQFDATQFHAVRASGDDSLQPVPQRWDFDVQCIRRREQRTATATITASVAGGAPTFAAAAATFAATAFA